MTLTEPLPGAYIKDAIIFPEGTPLNCSICHYHCRLVIADFQGFVPKPRMAPSIPLVYFESSWAILSSIGIVSFLYGIAVVGITSLSPLTIVPIVVSIALALANGLCYYAFYTSYPPYNLAIASAFADVFWLVSFDIPPPINHSSPPVEGKSIPLHAF